MADVITGEGLQIVARLERLPNSPWHVRMRAVVGTAYFFDAFDALTIAFVLPALIPLWHLGSLQISVLIATGYLGQAMGSVFFGWLAERIGRVPCAVICCIIFSALGLACAFAPGFEWLVVLRFCQGLGLGGEMPVMQSYLNEFSPTARRGGFAMVTQLPFAFGIVITSLVARWVVPHWGWQSMFVLGAVPALLTIWMRRVLPESPRWLASVGRHEEADRVLSGIEAKISAGIGRALPPVPELAIAELVGRLQPRRGHLRDLFRGVYRRRTLTLWVLWFTGYLVSYGLSAWMPSLYGRVYHLPLSDALMYGIYTSAALFLGGCLATATVDRIGRKPWLVVALLVSGVTLAALYDAPAMSAQTVMLISLVPFFGIGAISLLLGPYTAENYPTHLRALGTGVGNAWLRFASFVGPFLVGALLDSQGLGAVFVMFGLASAIGGATAWFFATETSGRLLEEISPVEQ
jgi:putative MFS transporter